MVVELFCLSRNRGAIDTVPDAHVRAVSCSKRRILDDAKQKSIVGRIPPENRWLVGLLLPRSAANGLSEPLGGMFTTEDREGMLNHKDHRWPNRGRMSRDVAWSLGILLATSVGLLAYWLFPTQPMAAAIIAVEAAGGDVSGPEAPLARWMRERGFSTAEKRTASPTSVSFSESKIGNDAIRALRSFRDLTFLDMRGAVVDDRTLIELFSRNHDGTTPFPVLTSLDLGESTVSDIGIREIMSCRKLGRLTLSGTRITDQTAAQIECLTKIWSLDLSDTGVTNEGLKRLRPLTRIQYLDLSETGVTNEGLKRLRPLTRIWHLDLSDTAVTNEGLKHLRPLTDLRMLQLAGAKISDIDPVSGFPFVEKIWSLDLSRTSIGNDAGLVLRQFVKLSTLRLASCDIDDGFLKAIRALPKLDRMDLQGTNVSDEGLAYLTAMKHLNYLDLTNTKVSDEGVTHLVKMKRLSHLDLTGTKVTPAGIRRLKTARYQISIVHESLSP